MKLYIFLFSLISVVLNAKIVDKIITIVNDEFVSMQELNYEYNKFKLSSGRLSGFEPYSLILSDLIKEESVQKSLYDEGFMLEVLIANKLIHVYARANSITVTDSEVEKLIDSIIERNNTTMEVFKSELLRQGLTLDDLKKNLKNRSLLEKIKQQKIFPKISISDLEMETFYKLNYKKLKKFNIAYIYIKSSPGDSEEAKKIVEEKLKNINKELKEENKDFFEVASSYTEGPYKVEGGRLGWVKQGLFNKKLEDAILELEKGKYSDFIKTENGYHMFKLLDLGEEDGKPYEELKNEIYQRLAYKKWHGIFMKWLDMLKRKYYLDYKTNYSNYGRGFSWNKWYNNIKGSKK